jgi:hypothetical protein
LVRELGSGPEGDVVMVAAIETVWTEGVEAAVVDADAIPAGGEVEAGGIGEVVGGTGDDEATGGEVEAGFVDTIPLGEVVVGGCGVNYFDNYGHAHVAGGANAEGAKSKGQHVGCGFGCPSSGEVAGSGLVLQVELVIVGKEVEGVLGHGFMWVRSHPSPLPSPLSGPSAKH